MRQIVLDTETTGIRVDDGHRMIEIGCVEMINRKPTGKHFHRYFNPEREVEAGALAVHGLSNDFLNDKPLFASVAEELMAFLTGAELIIHNAPFDLSFLNHEFYLTRKGWKPITHYCQVIDTLVMARERHVGQRNSLDALCKRYNIDNSKREMHGALLDAHLLLKVYLAMTGGQSSFFDAFSEATPAQSEQAAAVANVVLSNYQIKVVAASAEELAAHEDYIA
ncbi:MAG TPA: DNA polymerase III subunit epsilon, partial [Gammaproteobacteria bacterium]|nr:DNA polymerase III subunit epsilon [Gammaproteobacteria bacterium]